MSSNIPSLPSVAVCEGETAITAGKNIGVVETRYGTIRGYIHNGIYTFKGIPYGKARRFMPAEKPACWEGIRSCMVYGPVCPAAPSPAFRDEFAFAFHRSVGHSNEDCLNLNIWTKTNDGKKRPVMVWLHGGGFASESSIEFPSYDGESLARKDVVVVSFNHRLNVLGFLDLSAYADKYKYSANTGALDMVAALIWVKENIEGFGGDPTNVTIFGQSGGGGKVSCLLNAPLAKGLFHKAIVQSGSYPVQFIEHSLAQRISAALLQGLKLAPDQADVLETVPYDSLIDAGSTAILKVSETLSAAERPVFGLDWEPVHDGYFLPYQPNEPAAMALSTDIPLLVGSCKNEYMPFIPGLSNITMEDALARLQGIYGDKKAAYLAAVENAYPGTTKPSDYVGIDLLFRPLVISQANQKALAGTAPVYMYLFAWQSPVLDGLYKAFHCMDLPFVFNNVQRCEEMTGGGKEAYALADKISDAWVQFAGTGNPQHMKLPAWPAYTPHNGAVMIFDNSCMLKSHHDLELLAIEQERLCLLKE